MLFKNFLNELAEFNLIDLDIREIGIWPSWLKKILLIMLALVIPITGYFLKVKDIHQHQSIYAQKETILLGEYQRKAVKASELNNYRQQMIELRQIFGTLIEQFPKDGEVPGLLEDITDIADDSGLIIKSIALQPERVNKFYIEIPINIDVTGNYHDFGSFVSGVAALPRLVTLHDYSITQTNSNSLNLVVEAKSYGYKIQSMQ
ncbi:MAG: type 4a pilus biogenesis protein PilO [Porticoccaceae bacterium]|nr:type 4a pilus biogenesis protein PilO [Porticoccaceae bacterium]